MGRSDSESSVVEVSSEETQFVPQEGDDEVLWTVLHITAERKGMYKVKWDGVDPKTGKPWPQSWVAKHDVTDDLRHAWKLKQAKKEKGEEERKKLKKRESTASKKSRASKAPSTSSTTTTLKQRGQSTTTTRTPIPGDSEDDGMPPPPPPPTAKRKHSSTSTSSSAKKFKEDPDAESTTRPAKKRKLNPEVNPKRASSSGSKGKEPVNGEVTRTTRKLSVPTRGGKRSVPRAQEHEDSSDEEMRLPIPAAPPNVKGKGKGKARPDSDIDNEVISINSSSSAASERIQEMLDAIPPESDVDSDAGDSKKEGAVGKKPHLQKRTAGSIKSTAKIEVLVYDKRGNFIHGKQKQTTEVDVVGATSTKPRPRSHTPILTPRTLQRLEVHDRDVAVEEESREQAIFITSKLKTPPAAEEEPVKAKVPLFFAVTPEPDYHYEEPESEEKLRAPSVLDRDEHEQGGGMEDGDLQDDESIVGELTYPDQMHVDHPEPVNPEEEIIPTTTSKPNGIRRGHTPEDLPGRVADIILRARTNIFRIRKEPTLPEIVPETETDSSNRNTESQDSQPKPEEKAVLPAIVLPLTATRSERLISKMMPRSPHSRGGSRVSVIDEERFGTPYENHDDDAFNQNQEDVTVLSPVKETTPDRSVGIHNTKKPLRPLPVISPSAFAPHLPSSSLIESAADPVEEEDELMSSIEQFESPDKASSYVAQRGRELAARMRESGDEMEKRQRITLDEIIAKAGVARGKEKEREVSVVSSPHASGSGSGSPSPSRSHANTKNNEHADDDPIQVDDVQETQDEEETQPSADDSGPRKHVPVVCEEEEESTQDLLQERWVYEQQQQREEDVDVDVDVDVHAGWGVPADDGRDEQPSGDEDDQDEPSREDEQDEQDEPSREEEDFIVHEEDLLVHDEDAEGELEDNIPDFSMEQPSSSPPIPFNENEPPTFPREPSLPPPPAKSRSRSQSKSSRGSANKQRQARETAQEPEIPATNSTRHETPPVAKAQEVETDDERPHLEMAMSLLNKKSGEIYQMEQLIVAEQEKNAAMLAEMASLREQLKQANAQPSQRPVEDADAILALERKKWEEERAALNASLQRAIELKESAEKDRDFFRAEHSKASSFVLSVRGENMELEKRVQIAEGQAKVGVAQVKAVFAAHIASAQRDAREWRMQATFMREKIDRTNDEIRRRAAEEPELRARCEDLDEELESMQEQITNMDEEIKGKNEQIMHMEVERENWKQEAAKLSDDLNEANAKLDYLGKKGLSEAEVNANGHEFVYRCEWREDGPCQAVFLKQGDLRNHMFSAGHLNLD